MDEETNQQDTTVIAAVITAIVSYNSPESLMLPEDFATKVLEIIQNGVKKVEFTSCSCQHPICRCPLSSCKCQHFSCNCQHPSCSCTSVATCSECMTLSALSALETMFAFIEERNMHTTNRNDIASKVDNQPKEDVKTTFEDSLHLQQCPSTTAIEDWHFNATGLLSSRNSIDLLVKCLLSSSKFKSFLARKVLISGMKANLIGVFEVLTMLKQECLAAAQFCVPLLEILRDMMSRSKCRNISSTTFSFFKEMKLHNFIGARFSEDRKSFVDTTGFLEYLSLLCKVMKYVTCYYKKLDTEDMSFIVAAVENMCLPFGNYFFTIPRADKGHLICLEYVKVISSLLDIKFLENEAIFHEKIFYLSKHLRTRIHRYLKMAENCGLICNINFIGAKLNLQTTNNTHSVSSLKRQIILLVLKISAFNLKGKSNFPIGIEHDLESFWNEISSSLGKSKRHYSNNWLPEIFADQDDQWITALICLLIIYKELKNLQNKKHELRQMSGKTLDSQEPSPQTLQQTICPHRLFLQLVRFIDYDHLVLTDFLTSPETPFLFYFTQYMHVIIEDWPSFLSAFGNVQEDSSVNHNGVHDLENSISDKFSESDNASCGSTKHNVANPELSTPKALQLKTSSQSSVRVSQVPSKSGSLHPCQVLGEVITVSTDPLQSSTPASINPMHSLEPQSNSLPSSIAQDKYNSQLPAESHLALQSSAVVSRGPFMCTTSDNMLYLLTPNSDPCNSSSSCNDVLKEHLVNQNFNNNEYSVSQSHRDDAIVYMCDRVASRSCTSLVAYSDSSSETSMTEPEVNFNVEKESVEEHCEIGLSCEVGSRMEININSLSEQDSGSDDGHLSELGSATDSMVDQCAKCNEELDAVMGMMIRLRLHVERLDHSKMFPYNVKSLLRLLESCEELYEMPSGS